MCIRKYSYFVLQLMFHILLVALCFVSFIEGGGYLNNDMKKDLGYSNKHRKGVKVIPSKGNSGKEDDVIYTEYEGEPPSVRCKLCNSI